MWPSILLRGEQDVRRADPFASFIQRRGYKTSKVYSVANRNNTGKTREILGQAWVDDRRTISNRARQRVNPGNTGRCQNTGEQARQDYNNLEGSVE